LLKANSSRGGSSSAGSGLLGAEELSANAEASNGRILGQIDKSFSNLLQLFTDEAKEERHIQD
jgi:hypothetical protein